jgi:hypothetical protein
VYDINKIEMLFIDMKEYSDQAKTDERTNERTNEMDTTTTTTTPTKNMSAALCGAALKRAKKVAAAAARAAGKVAAAARRTEDHTARDKAFAEEAALIDRQIECARRALGVRKNEPNPTSICLMIETLTFQMRIRLSEKGYW